MQEYCYENTSLMQGFQKLVILFYKVDVLTEEAVLKWYHTNASSKGKRVFLEQMKKFVEWLENAEEGTCFCYCYCYCCDVIAGHLGF